MTLSTQDALIYLMVVAATSDAKVSDRELDIIGNLVSRSPVFEGFDRDHLGQVAAEAIDLIKDSSSLDNVLEMIFGAIPERLRDTAASVNKFGLRREDFLAIIDGMEMDVPADIRAPDDATLDLYCDRVASAVGRLSVRVFGLPEQDGIQLAHHLGRALQLTNILRDIDEDAAIGRLYLPQEGLLHAGITNFDLAAVLANPALPRVCMPLVKRAQMHFMKSDEILKRNSRRAVRAPRIMSKYYRTILDLLEQRGFQLPREPVRLSKAAKIAIIIRYAFI